MKKNIFETGPPGYKPRKKGVYILNPPRLDESRGFFYLPGCLEKFKWWWLDLRKHWILVESLEKPQPTNFDTLILGVTDILLINSQAKSG